MKDYDLYLFDFDLTLADSERAILMCFERVFEKHSAPLDREAARRTIGLPLLTAIMQLSGRDEQTSLEWKHEYTKFGDELMVKNIALFPNTLAMLDSLKAAGKKTGIISTKAGFRIKQSLEHIGITDRFDLVYGLENVPRPKPDPTGILSAIAELKETRETTLYVGDNEIDALAGKNAGVDFAAVTTGMTTKEEFETLPHVLIMSDIGELIIR